MPPGWLQVTDGGCCGYWYITEVTVTPPAVPDDACAIWGKGLDARYWRPHPGSAGSSDYVCAYRQFHPPVFEGPDDWYFGLPWRVGTGDPRDVYLRLTVDASKVAQWYKPGWFFDTSEKWRPLDVERFLQERDTSGNLLHRLCVPLGSADADTYLPGHSTTVADADDQTNPSSGVPEAHCSRISSVSDIAAISSPDAYLDLQSLYIGDESSYFTPDTTCRTGILLDCNQGPSSAVYWKLGQPESGDGYRYLQYWAFYRFNSYTDSPVIVHHEGDWEAVALAPSQTTPGTFDFASFASHGPWFSYLRTNLRCYSRAWGSWRADACGTETSKSGSRVGVYVANGSHSSYPHSCSETVPASCPRGGSSRGERGYDGTRAWGNNAAGSTGLQPMTSLGTAVSWPGEWGAGTGPPSPGSQQTYVHSWDGCAVDNDGCPAPATVARRVRQRRASGRTLRTSQRHCQTWFGPMVRVLICGPSTLRRALNRRSIGRRGSGWVSLGRHAASISRRHTLVTATGASLVQSLGSPLRVGDTVRVETPAGGGRLFVRVQSHRRTYELVTRLPPPGTERTVRFRVLPKGSGRPTLKRI
jgi:hypothetical protein